MNEWRFVKNVHYIKKTKWEVQFAIVTNILVKMVLNGAGLGKKDMSKVVVAVWPRPKIPEIIVSLDYGKESSNKIKTYP